MKTIVAKSLDQVLDDLKKNLDCPTCKIEPVLQIRYPGNLFLGCTKCGLKTEPNGYWNKIVREVKK